MIKKLNEYSRRVTIRNVSESQLAQDLSEDLGGEDLGEDLGDTTSNTSWIASIITHYHP